MVLSSDPTISALVREKRHHYATFMRESSRLATRSLSSLTRARMLSSFLLASLSFLLASARAARLGATTCALSRHLMLHQSKCF